MEEAGIELRNWILGLVLRHLEKGIHQGNLEIPEKYEHLMKSTAENLKNKQKSQKINILDITIPTQAYMHDVCET